MVIEEIEREAKKVNGDKKEMQRRKSDQSKRGKERKW